MTTLLLLPHFSILAVGFQSWSKFRSELSFASGKWVSLFCFWQMSILIRKRTSIGLWCCWTAQAQQKRRISRLGQQSTCSYSEPSCKLWNFHQLNWSKCWYKLWFLWKKAGVWGRDSLLVFVVTDEAATEKVFEHPRARNHPFTVALVMVSFENEWWNIRAGCEKGQEILPTVPLLLHHYHLSPPAPIPARLFHPFVNIQASSNTSLSCQTNLNTILFLDLCSIVLHNY